MTIVVKETLTNLRQRNQCAVPNEYHKEFCQVAKKYELHIEECHQFKKLVEKLSKDEQAQIKEENIQTMEEMIPVLLKRVAKKNVKNLAGLLTKSTIPSINVSLDESLAKFTIKIDNSPELIFEEDIQKEMQNFINQRFEVDRKIVQQKTADIAKLVTLMGQYLNDAIKSSTKGSENLNNIKGEIESFDIKNDGLQELSDLQSKLISAAVSIESEMNEVGKKLDSGHSHVKELENKIESLEQQLEHAKKESSTDHLTGLLTRRAYNDLADQIEKDFERVRSHYAVIFFDIDHFKAINDNYGHEAGDVILSTFAKILQSQTRDIDVLARYGGEEFVALVKYQKVSEVTNYVKRIKKIIADNKFKYNKQSIQVTFSAGITLRVDHMTYASAIQKADVLLYDAKESGRNQIHLEDGTVL